VIELPDGTEVSAQRVESIEEHATGFDVFEGQDRCADTIDNGEGE
jgi:hypothetical protein